MRINKIKLILLLTLLNYGVSLVLFKYRDLISEYLVVNTIQMTSIGRTNEWMGLYFYDGQPYTSQPGFQGFFFRTMLPTGVGVSSISYVLIFLVSLSFNYIFVNCVCIIKERFGLLSAALFSIPLLLSGFYWLDSGNLYWLYPLYIAPFYLSLSKIDLYSTKKLCAILFLIFLAKFCTGFEYAPVIIVSAVVPIVIFGFEKNTLWLLFGKIASIGIAGVLAFAVALFILIINEAKVQKTEGSITDVVQSYVVTGNNKPHFLKYRNNIYTTINQYTILNNIGNSTSSHANGWSDVLKARDAYLGYSSLKDYFSFSGKKAIFYTIQAILSLFLLVALVFLATVHFEMVAIVLASLISIAAAAIWVALMPLHFYLHSVHWRGVSDIILIFPFYSILGLALGVYLKMKLDAQKKRFKNL